MTLLDYLTLAVFFALGVFVGISISNAFNRYVMRSLLEELKITPADLKKLENRLLESIREKDPEAYAEIMKRKDGDQPIVRIKLEQHQGTLYAYREDTNEFLGQGTDKESLVTSIGHRMKNCTVEIINAELLVKNG